MNVPSRRQFLTVGAGVATSFAGCQSLRNPEVSVFVQVINTTPDLQETYVELRNDVGADSGESVSEAVVDRVKAGNIARYELSMDPDTYAMELILDDVLPRPEKTVEWEITDDTADCDRNKTWIIEPAEAGLNLRFPETRCENRAKTY